MNTLVDRAAVPGLVFAAAARGLRPKGWPIKAAIATVVVLSMLVLAAAIISLGWRSSRDNVLAYSSKAANDGGLLVSERARRILAPAQASLQLLATTGLKDATTLEERMAHIGTLVDVLTSNELASAVYVGYADGSFLLVRPLDTPEVRKLFNAPPKANFLVQSVHTRPGGTIAGQYLYYNADLSFIQRMTKDEYRFDPRQRPWYLGAANVSATFLSEPYVFYSTGQVGVTLSRSSTGRNAVFGLDVALDDLGKSLAELKLSPNAELAVVDAAGKVLAYPDMARMLDRSGDRVELKNVQALGVPGLAAAFAAQSSSGQVESFDVDGKAWLGASIPFDVWRAAGAKFVVAFPADDLLGDLKARQYKLVLTVIALCLLLLPLGWWAGASIGRSLDKLTDHAQQMGRFDFRRGSAAASQVREANTLNGVLNDLGQTIETFLQISHDMAVEPKVERMLDNVLYQMVTATRCTAGAVYLRDGNKPTLRCASFKGGFTAVSEPHSASSDAKGMVRRKLAGGQCELQVDLRGRKGDLEGVLLLQHEDDEVHSDPAFVEFVSKLSGMLAVTVETRQLIEAQKLLLDAFVKVMADAIDAKSPYTGGHCERVPVLAGMIVDHMGKDPEGPYADFSLTDDERYEFHLGAWLHDCGKVTSPEHVIDKSTKLETIYNRIHEIRTRFEVLWRDAEITYWQGIAGGASQAQLKVALEAAQRQLQDDFAFVAQCNAGSESMEETSLGRLQALSRTTWQRHFDSSLGLSADELRRLPPPQTLPAIEHLLADRPEHIIHWGPRKPAVEKSAPGNAHGFDMALPQHAQNMGELHNLAVRKGTLTAEDRFRINDHIVQTLAMLRSLPWPAHLARVPDIAATHHEKLDGTGYPRRLKAEALTTVDRVMAMADIFEALTAADRPYKAAKNLTESLKIMAHMAKDQHLDPVLFRYFLRSNLWHAFGKRYLRPEQVDAVNVADIERIVPDAVTS